MKQNLYSGGVSSMTAFDQFRANGLAEVQTPTVAIDSAPTGGSILQVRLRTRLEAGQLGAAGGEILDPAVCLTTDLIKASGGDPVESDGQIFVARFTTVQDGVLAARRLQWAAQGFFESQNLKETPFAVLVQRPEDSLDPTANGFFAEALEHAEPGQILLTENVGKALGEMAGFSLGAASDAGFRELIWRGPDRHSTRTTDEMVISWFIEQKGPEFRAEAVADVPAETESGNADKAATGWQDGRADEDRKRVSDVSNQGRTRLILLIGGAVAVVSLVAAVLAFHPFGGHQARVASSPAPTIQPASAQAAPVQAAPVQLAPVQTPVPSEPPQSVLSRKPSDKKTRQQNASEAAVSKTVVVQPQAVVEPPKVETPKPVKQSANCDLDPGQYAGEVDQAETNLARGNYSNAERQFLMVLACDSGNSRARGGLEKVHQAKAANGTQ